MDSTHPGRPTDLRQHLQLVAVHESAQPKVGDHDVGIFGWSAEQEVLGFEICGVGPRGRLSQRRKEIERCAPLWTMSASWMYVTALKMERTRAAASLERGWKRE